MQRYHYLEYKTPFGLHLRYLIVSGERILGCILYTASTWASEYRDKIGKTKGRGRQDRHSKGLFTIEDIYVYILDANFREELAR
ncbi:MAG: hypothetical protein ACMUIU_03170 [bacterium]